MGKLLAYVTDQLQKEMGMAGTVGRSPSAADSFADVIRRAAVVKKAAATFKEIVTPSSTPLPTPKQGAPPPPLSTVKPVAGPTTPADLGAAAAVKTGGSIGSKQGGSSSSTKATAATSVALGAAAAVKIQKLVRRHSSSKLSLDAAARPTPASPAVDESGGAGGGGAAEEAVRKAAAKAAERAAERAAKAKTEAEKVAAAAAAERACRRGVRKHTERVTGEGQTGAAGKAAAHSTAASDGTGAEAQPASSNAPPRVDSPEALMRLLLEEAAATSAAAKPPADAPAKPPADAASKGTTAEVSACVDPSLQPPAAVMPKIPTITGALPAMIPIWDAKGSRIADAAQVEQVALPHSLNLTPTGASRDGTQRGLFDRS